MPAIPAETWEQYLALTAEVLDPANGDRAPELMVKLCNTLLPSNDAMVSVFGASIKPVRLYDNVPDDIHEVVIGRYFDGSYLLDPYYRAAIGGIPSGLYRLNEIAPPGFTQSEYYRRYYKASNTGDECGFLFQFGDGCTGYISLANTTQQPNYRKAGIERLRTSERLLFGIFSRHWQDIRNSTARGGSALHSQLELALAKFGESILTRRESEVIRMYLQGHNTRSIADRLEISTHTVALHRKHAYSKLDISSQFELFHLFIDSLSCFDPAACDDPLKRYLARSRP